MSGADIISVNFAQLRAAADQLSAKANVLTGHMDALQRSLQPLKETWVASNSSAGQAAQQSETRLRQAIAVIINVLEQGARGDRPPAEPGAEEHQLLPVATAQGRRCFGEPPLAASTAVIHVEGWRRCDESR